MNARKALIHRLILVAVIFVLTGSIGLAPAAAQFSGQSYIVQADTAAGAARLVETVGGQVTSDLAIIHGVGALLTAEAAGALRRQPGVTAVTLNSTVRSADSGGNEQGGTGNSSPATDYPDVVGADFAWEQGSIGSGVSVAVVDTGIGLHRGLVRDVDHQKGRIIAWLDLVGGETKPVDPNGHGTHIAGIIANSQIGDDGEWTGVAPGVNLVGVRVLDETGYGTYETVISGIQWVIENKDLYNIKVMNLSLVSPVQSPYWADPLNQAVTLAWAEGITVVVAAGNDGPGPMSISVPGNNPYVITVGAFTDAYTPYDWSDDYMAPFSAAGPTLDAFVKPDLVAPGAHMVAPMLPASELAREHDSSQAANQYFAMAGTSQAAAVVSGVSALVLAQNPDLTPNEVKYRLMYTALPWVDPETTNAVYSVWQQGFGRLNAPDAVYAEIEGEANAGMNIWGDLAGYNHYEGYTDYDQSTGEFRLRSDYDSWAGGFGAWSGGFGAWSGGFGAWSGGFGAWSGGFGAWSGGFGAWSGGFGAWSGGFGAWSGGFGAWSGGFGAWSGGFGAWSGSEPWMELPYGNPAFVESFMRGASPSVDTLTTLSRWVDEP